MAEPPASVVDILLRTKLMQPTGDKSALHITNTGYEFMLMDVHVQVKLDNNGFIMVNIGRCGYL